MFKITRKKLVAGAVTAGLIAGAGVSFAYWTTTGAGTGSATTGDVDTVTVNQTLSSDEALYPGGPATTLSGNFDNLNPGKVYIANVTVVVDPEWETADTIPCTADDFTVGGSAVVNAEIDSGVSVGGWTGLTLKLDDRSTNQDACKDVTVPLIYTAHAS